MDNYTTKTEREIDLKDLLYRILKQWRQIVLCAVIIALLGALYKVYSGIHVILDDEAYAEAQEKYEIALNDYEATGVRLRTNIANLRTQSTNQQEYNEKSELMKIDPMNKWVGSFQIYIDSKYQIDPTMTYQNVDLTNRLVSAYSSYLRSGELYTAILNDIDTVDEIRFLTELYGVSADSGTATITVNYIGKNETDVREFLEYVKEKIADRFETIRSAIGDHSYEIMTESVYTVIDFELDSQQKVNLLAISEYANSIGDLTQRITEWEREPTPKQEFGTVYTIKQSIKFFILGGIVGAILLCVWYALKYVLSDTVKTDEDWKRYGIPVFAHIRKDNKKVWLYKIDEWIDRAFGKLRIGTMNQLCALAANNLNAAAQKEGLSKVMFVGRIPRELADEMVQIMNSAVPACDFSYVGDVLRDPETSNRVTDIGKTVLVADNQTTKICDLERTISLLRTWGKTISGVVTIE